MANSRICSVPGCGKSGRITRGLCNSHYHRWSTYGDPLGGGTSHGEPERYFRENVLTYDGNDCLDWPYALNAYGYAVLRLEGKAALVSRLVCEHEHGPAPSADHQAAHSCGRGKLGCVTKAHLRWATQAQNEGDKLVHGTDNRGERHWHSKLTEEDARAILGLKGKMLQREIAELYGLKQSTVSNIHTGKLWGWLSN